MHLRLHSGQGHLVTQEAGRHEVLVQCRMAAASCKLPLGLLAHILHTSQ